MRAHRRLDKLQKTACRRLLTLREAVAELAPPVGPDADRLVAYTVIESWNLWAGFCRSLYLSCAIGATTASGHRITHAQPFGSVTDDALLFAANLRRQRPLGSKPVSPRDEPAWQDPSTLIYALSELGATNTSQVSAGLSISTDVYQRMPTLRNFYAHRSKATAEKVARVARSIAMNPLLRPSELLVSCRRRRPQNVLADWLDDIRNSIDIACQ